MMMMMIMMMLIIKMMMMMIFRMPRSLLPEASGKVSTEKVGISLNFLRGQHGTSGPGRNISTLEAGEARDGWWSSTGARPLRVRLQPRPSE